MVKSQSMIIFTTCLLSCIAAGLTIASLCTKYWVVSDFVDSETRKSAGDAYFGLFEGMQTQTIFTSERKFNIKMTCLFKNNKCAWSCLEGDARSQEVEKLINGEDVNFQCSPVNVKLTMRNKTRADENKPERIFINAGVWITTIICLSASILLAIVAALFAIINTSTNPSEPLFGVFGLFIWNALALGFDLLILFIWGIHFAVTITHNIGLVETILGVNTSDGLAHLGFSYWLIIPAMLIHAANLGLLFYRRYRLNLEPTVKISIAENTDGTIFLF